MSLLFLDFLSSSRSLDRDRSSSAAPLVRFAQDDSPAEMTTEIELCNTPLSEVRLMASVRFARDAGAATRETKQSGHPIAS